MENVVPIANLSDFIEESVLKVRLGLAQARIAGTLVEMPEVIQFSVVVVKEWQPVGLAYNSTDIGTNTGGQGGSTTTVTDGTSVDTGIEIGTDTDSSNSNQTATNQDTTTESSTSTDQDSTTEVVISAENDSTTEDVTSTENDSTTEDVTSTENDSTTDNVTSIDKDITYDYADIFNSVQYNGSGDSSTTQS